MAHFAQFSGKSRRISLTQGSPYGQTAIAGRSPINSLCIDVRWALLGVDILRGMALIFGLDF
jgi:hypothetical protein